MLYSSWTTRDGSGSLVGPTIYYENLYKYIYWQPINHYPPNFADAGSTSGL